MGDEGETHDVVTRLEILMHFKMQKQLSISMKFYLEERKSFFDFSKMKYKTHDFSNFIKQLIPS